MINLRILLLGLICIVSSCQPDSKEKKEGRVSDGDKKVAKVDIAEIEPVYFTLERFEQTGIGTGENGLRPVLKTVYEMILDEVESQARARLVEEGGARLREEIESLFRDLF
jgi:hypothetical protein